MRAASVVFELAAQKGVKPGQVALAWLLHKGDDIVPIPGTKRRTYLEENVGSAAVTLTAAEVEKLDRALPPGSAVGPRYPEQLAALMDRSSTQVRRSLGLSKPNSGKR